jgi:hypothetical protein
MNVELLRPRRSDATTPSLFSVHRDAESGTFVTRQFDGYR